MGRNSETPCYELLETHREYRVPEPCLVRLTQENELLVEIYNLVRTQLIVGGMDGVVLDVDFNSIKIVFDLYEIPDYDRRKFFLRLVRVLRTRIKESKEELENQEDDTIKVQHKGR